MGGERLEPVPGVHARSNELGGIGKDNDDSLTARALINPRDFRINLLSTKILPFRR